MITLTAEQDAFIDSLLEEGYKFNQSLVKEYNGVVLSDGLELWIFTLKGEIIHEFLHLFI